MGTEFSHLIDIIIATHKITTEGVTIKTQQNKASNMRIGDAVSKTENGQANGTKRNNKRKSPNEANGAKRNNKRESQNEDKSLSRVVSESKKPEEKNGEVKQRYMEKCN
jgi:hypothetical protein